MQITRKGNKLWLKFDYNRRLVNDIKEQCESARWNPDQLMWSVRDCPRNWYILNHVLKDSDEYNRYYRDVPDGIQVIPRWDSVLWSHQRTAARTILWRRRMLYAGDMGVGKTLSIFAVLDTLVHRSMSYGLPSWPETWWVADKNALRAYESEYRNWKPQFEPAVIINYESLHRVVSERERPPRIVVFDESTALKNIRSLRTQSGLGLVETMEQAYGDNMFVILATGTPFPKDYRDWYGQLEVCRPGFLREGSITKFTKRLAEVEEHALDTKKYFTVKSWKPDEIEFLAKRLAPIVLRHERGKDTPDMRITEKRYHQIRLNPGPSLVRAAKIIAETSESVAVALGKLRQLSDGFLYGDNSANRVDCPKDGAVLQLLEEYAAYKRAIFYGGFTESVDRVVDVCISYGWNVIRVDGRGVFYITTEGPEIADPIVLLRKFQVPITHKDAETEPIAFVGNPQAGGKGVTLTASPFICFYSNTFKFEDRAQAEDRIMRDTCIGANIYDLIHLESDELVLSNLLKKRDMSEVTLERIRGLWGQSVEDNPGPD